MEFFNKANAVRLTSHLHKFLVADDDGVTVRQSRNGSSKKARWTVELVPGNPHAIRLKSCNNRYLTASDEPFLLGMTGNKVLQTDTSSEWEPIKEGYRVRLRTKGGKFLRANGATPPWRNSVTHDLPHRTATQDWVLWDVDTVQISVFDAQFLSSNASDFSEDYSYPNSPSIGKQAQGMEFFNKAKAVRLQSHLGKYLLADDDKETIRQSRNGASHNARWVVEFVEGKRGHIRLKSFHGLYLTASNEPFLMGMTGKKVIQTKPQKITDDSVEWEPIKEGLHVKLMTSDGKFLRGNGGAPPWKNSVTHDVPHRTMTQSWVLWGVNVVEIAMSDPDAGSGWLSPVSSISSIDYTGSPDTGSPMVQSYGNAGSRITSMKKVCAIDILKKAKTIKLKSHLDKYLTAESDRETVVQGSRGAHMGATWTVELVEGMDSIVRLQSCYGKYLTASDEELLRRGKKVVQSNQMGSSVEWEPIRDGVLIKLKSRYGNYLCGNGGVPPWRNTVTHDVPIRHQEWSLWEVEVVQSRHPDPDPDQDQNQDNEEDIGASFHLTFPIHPTHEEQARKLEGRVIYYHVADEEGEVKDKSVEGFSFHFKGNNVEELTHKLEEEVGLEGIIVCSRNKFNGKLHPLRLALPPNNATMHVVVLPSSGASVLMPP